MAICLGLGLVSHISELAGQSEKFSATSEYQAILAELKTTLMRPSHISSGEMLRKSEPPVEVQARETGQALKLETALWRWR